VTDNDFSKQLRAHRARKGVQIQESRPVRSQAQHRRSVRSG
jgi:hypothetical protein